MADGEMNGPPAGCERADKGFWIRVGDSWVEFEQVAGGSRGTDYVYVEEGGLFVPLAHLRGAVLVAREEWGRGRRREVYKAPKASVEGRLILQISFTNSGYMLLRLCRVAGGGVECYLCGEEAACDYAHKFKTLGGERNFAKVYMDFVPRLAEEIRRIAEASGAELFFAGHSERLREAVEKPCLSLFTSMALDKWQSRLMSLQEKVSAVFELWVAAKVVEALGGETVSIEGGEPRRGGRWWIERAANVPFAYIHAAGEYYTIYYQPTIYPHVLYTVQRSPDTVTMSLKGPGASTTPDLVVFKGLVKEYVGWGELYKLVEAGRQALLLVEAKTGLEAAEWRRPERVVEQLRAYISALKPRRTALAVLTALPSHRDEIKRLGVDIFENLAKRETHEAFKKYVQEAAKI